MPTTKGYTLDTIADMKSINSLVLTLLLLFTLSAKPSAAPCIPCEEIVKSAIPDVTILKAENVLKPAPHCLVTGVIGKEINFEVALPEEGNSRC